MAKKIIITIPDDWNGNATLEFKDGEISAEGNIRTEGFADDESFSLNLNKEQAYKLYLVMKKYYEK